MSYSNFYRYRLSVSAALVFLLLFFIAPITYASTISRAYHIDGNPTNGNLVSLDSTEKGSGHLATIANSSDLLGIVVGQHDSLLAIDPADNTVQVALSGTAPVLVSTLYGDIKVGDLISVSSIKGVGSKAQPGLPLIGRAKTAFTDRSANATTQQVTDKNGKTTTVKVGFVNVQININTSPGVTSPSLNGLQRIFQSLTGRVIPTIRIIISLVILVITLVALSMFIYASIFGSIISIGRNPLAKSAIIGTLRSVLLLSILLAGIAGIVLTLLLS